jgi:chemotaxis methyl-accepting protein methylase
VRAACQSPRGSRFEHVIFVSRQRAARRAYSSRSATADHVVRHEGDREATDAQRLFLQYVFNAAGLNVDCYRPDTLHRRIPACLRELRVASLAEARRVLERDPASIHRAVGALLIGVSSFFRDANVFADIANIVLPALVDSKHCLRVWSIGCADGEELHSVAMLLAEAGRLESAALLGSDCRASAIAQAREGVYSAASLRQIPPQRWERHLVRESMQVRMAQHLRARIHWRIADVTRIIEPGAWDLILCRNMAMYLRSDAAAALWRRLEQALRPGGFLILGKAERPMGAHRLSAVSSCVYRRVYG